MLLNTHSSFGAALPTVLANDRLHLQGGVVQRFGLNNRNLGR